MNTIETIIREHGGIDAVRRRHIRIENKPFLRLVIEVVAGPFPGGSHEIGVAHYGEQNGDAMRDPEITFLVLQGETKWEWTPLTFLNDYVGVFQTAARYNADGVVERQDARLVRELVDFSPQWDSNLKHQGFLEAYRKVRRD